MRNNCLFQSESTTLKDQTESTFGDLTAITVVLTKEENSAVVRQGGGGEVESECADRL